MLLADFDDLFQIRFKKSIAAAAGGVLEDSVSVDKITARIAGRRLLAESIRLDISVYAVDKDSANVIASKLTGHH